jgi:hypothetical protein
MYKVQVDCDKQCSVLLMSKDEIKTIRNTGAIVSNPDEKKETNGLTESQIQALIKALESISFKKKDDQKEERQNTEGDSCLTVNKLWYEKFSCYIDSVLFTLLAFPTPFVERYLLHPDFEEIEDSLTVLELTELNGEFLTPQQIKKVMAYIKRINQILIEINDHFRGTKRMDYCRNLRPVLLKDPLMILEEKPKYEFAKNNQEDAGEFVQALFKTFFINTITFISTKFFSNSIDTSIPDYIRENGIQKVLPFFVYRPEELQTKHFEINKNTITTLDLDNYFFGNQTKNSTFQSNKLKAETLKKVKMCCILKEILETLKKNKKTTVYNIPNKPSDPEYKEKIDLLIDVIFQNKHIDENLEILQIFTLLELETLFNVLKDRSGKFFTDTLYPLIEKFKKDQKSCYYTSGLELIKQHSIYYNEFNESEMYELNNNLEENKLIVINVKRFADMRNKDNRAIEIPEQIIITDAATKENVVLGLNQMVIHRGTTLAAGHYTVRFRCKNKWYLYDDNGDMGPIVELYGKSGTLQEIIQDVYIKQNCTLLIYSSINPTI